MYGNITGIDITSKYLTVVQTRSSLKGRRVVACTQVPVDPADLNAAFQSLTETVNLKNDTCLVSIPDDQVAFRNLHLPFKDAKKVRQVLPFEIESMLPVPIEDLLIDFIIVDDPAGGGIFAASVKKTFISEYLGALHANGIDPDILDVRGAALASWVLGQGGTPDHLLVLEIGWKRHALVLCLGRRIVLIRSFVSVPVVPPLSEVQGDAADEENLSHEGMEGKFQSLCAVVHQTVHAYLAGVETEARPEQIFFTGEGAQGPLAADLLSRFLDMPAFAIDVSQDRNVSIEPDMAGEWSPALMSSALALTLRNGGKQGGFNFRRDEFSRERHYLGFRKALPKLIVFGVLILSFLAADMIIDTYALKNAYGTLDQQITAVFRETMPRTTRIVDPVQQLRISVEEMKRSAASNPGTGPQSTVLDLLREISRRIPGSIRVEVRRMVVDPDTVRISGTTDAFNEVDQIKNNLAGADLFGAVNITSANLDRSGKKVQFDIAIDRKH